MSAPFHTASDADRNPALSSELGQLRGIMVDAAERTPLPKRFYAVPHETRPAMTIMDTETGRSVVTGLCNYGGVREALSALFPDD